MYKGIFSKTFPATSVDACFRQIAELGYQALQFNFKTAGLDELPDHVSPHCVTEVQTALRNHNLKIEALSATFNLIHPDQEAVERGLACLETLASVAPRLGCTLLTLCTGTLDRDNMWRFHPGNNKPATWDVFIRNLHRAVVIAEKYDICLGIEPEQANVVNSAEKARQAMDDMPGDRVKIIFDAANLFEQAEAEERKRIIEKALDLLAPDIAIVHAKDRLANGDFVAAGKGVLDYRHYLSVLKKHGYDGAVIAHGLDASEAAGVAAMLDAILAEVEEKR